MGIFDGFLSKKQNMLYMPSLDKSNIDLVTVKECLEKDVSLWLWYSAPKHSFKDKCAQFLSSAINRDVDSLRVLEKDGDLLVLFDFSIQERNKPLMTAREFRKYSNTEILKVIEEEIKNAYKVYYDKERKAHDVLRINYWAVCPYDELIEKTSHGYTVTITDDEYMDYAKNNESLVFYAKSSVKEAENVHKLFK